MKICEHCGNRNYYKLGDHLKCSGCGREFKLKKFTPITDGNTLTRPKPNLDAYDAWTIKNPIKINQ